MTREEAIKELSYIADEMPSMECADWKEAISMAIKALEQELSNDGTLTVNVEDGNKVSRVLVCGENHFGGLYYPEQEPKTGHWIEQDGFDGDIYYDCSECGESFCLIDGTPTDNMYNYCPNCGARLESEDK